MNKKELTQDYLQECFEYVDGDLIWRRRPERHFSGKRYHTAFNNRFAGKVAFTGINPVHGYEQGSLNKVIILKHFAVWVYHNGQPPAGRSICHRDGDKLNCKIENLKVHGLG